MKIKKTLCALLAVTAVCTAGLTSCSNNSSAGTNSNNSAARAQADVEINVLEVADRLKNEVKYVDTLNELNADMIQKIIGISADQYSSGIVYVGSGGATAEEIACFEAVDADNAGKIKIALENRVEQQKVAFENYQPKEMEKLGSPVIISKGNYVFMCISDENAKAEEIIG